jgi:N-acetylneuraminic acid mutarotase
VLEELTMNIISYLSHHGFIRFFRSFTNICLSILMLTGFGLFIPDTIPTASAHPLSTLKQLINSDGTLNLNQGFNGPIDLAGWQVKLDGKRGPVFIHPDNTNMPTTSTVRKLIYHPVHSSLLSTSQSFEWLPFPNNGLDNLSLNNTVLSLVVVGHDLYVGGVFTETADGLVKDLNAIAKFDTLTYTWSSLPNMGLSGGVEAMALIGSDLYVGGSFIQTADGSLTDLGRIARYSLTENKWYALPNGGLGLSGEVQTMAVVGDDLYVGGRFENTGDYSIQLLNIAKFSAGTWSALPNNGLSGTVISLAVDGNDMYVGGVFTTTGDSSVADLNDIARFDLSNNSWHALPNKGLNSSPQAFAFMGNSLYVSGQFTGTYDGEVTNLNHIARLTGETWYALPNNGLDANVYTLAVSGTDLYVGGHFHQTADGSVIGINHIAVLNIIDNTWSTLSNGGLDATVQALSVNGGYLIAGGQFKQTADGAVTELNHIAAYSGVAVRINTYVPLIMR